MYQYQEHDRQFLQQRVAEFRWQVARRLKGELTEEEFRPLRLMNGLYLQLHAYMLRVAIPYGVLSSAQLRQLGHIAKKYDRGFGHFTTRQNIQFNWIRLIDTPDILADLAAVDMHAIQTSGNCIRNVTTDPYAGVAADEYEDPRAWAEILRQWSTLHPEFSFLPRKFKIAITGAKEDRAAIAFHDIGIKLVPNPENPNEIGFQLWAGGGQGRTPFVAKLVREFLPKKYLLSYLEAMLRVYNLYGRRDNLYKARIKILVHEMGLSAYQQAVEQEWQGLKDSSYNLPMDIQQRILQDFAQEKNRQKVKDHKGSDHLNGDKGNNAKIDVQDDAFRAQLQQWQAEHGFETWYRANVAKHRDEQYVIVTIVLKDAARMPGDAMAEEMQLLADLADEFSAGELRVSYIQNLVLPWVKKSQLGNLYQALKTANLHQARKDYASDVICCPGLDYCSLANARSLPIAAEIVKTFADKQLEDEFGALRINLSGCINACGHHHSGHIGILGVDKKGVEAYQISIGGDPGDQAGGLASPAIGQVLGRAISAEQIPDVLKGFLKIYRQEKKSGEQFLSTAKRIGLEKFKEVINGMGRS